MTLAGLATGKLVDVVEAAFGGEETEAECEALEEVFQEDDPKEDPSTDQPSTSHGIKHKSSASTSTAKHQVSHPSKGGIIPLKDATLYYPTVNDNKKSKDFMQSCFLIFVYFKCCSGFLLYFYKCSTSMAFA